MVKKDKFFQKKILTKNEPKSADFAKYHFLTRDFGGHDKNSCGSQDHLQGFWPFS